MNRLLRLVVAGLALSVLPRLALLAQDTSAGAMDMGGMVMDHSPGTAPSAMMIIPMMKNPMLPGMAGMRPKTTPWLPGAGVDITKLPEAKPREDVLLQDGDTLDLTAMMVQRAIKEKPHIMYGYNGQYPGPLLRVKQNSTIYVRFANKIDLPTTVHWHGVRLENKFDGVPDDGMQHGTQPEVPPGGTFLYKLTFPDAGIYWYHPHVREDIQQDLGLYGNIVVESLDPAYYSPVNSEEILMLDDILMDGDSLIPFGKEAPDFAPMGRFGTVLLVNGEAHYHKMAQAGDVIRFVITNVANTRTFNLNFGVPVKLVAADESRYEKEMMTDNVVIAPAQRYVVEARYPQAGDYYITNSVVALDHMMGEFFQATDTVGMVMAQPGAATPDRTKEFQTLRVNAPVKAEIDKIRAEFDRPPDHELVTAVEMKDLPIIMLLFISIDTIYRAPVEFTDAMSDMNWIGTGREVRWILRDKATGKENMNVDWPAARQGSYSKIRLINDIRAFHPMNHPIHVHGQRFLVIARDGHPVESLAWSDTVLLPVGQTVDLLVENSNPGKWMLHCHIAEHLGSGMMMNYTVAP
ncbi:MAG: multicopper oxidase family protein [Gemmatimonadetes bacterium]|nr:multicopper oxidase family protein [Gemmatimonadota bacterium]